MVRGLLLSVTLSLTGALLVVCVGCDPFLEPTDHRIPDPLKWILIPGGTFEMGCSPGDDKCQQHETVHTVSISAFEMLETEVTVAQMEAVAGISEQQHYDCGKGRGSTRPASCLGWTEAMDYCEAVGGRLPTEAEWEYAARGGTDTRYYCGHAPECLDAIAWFDENSSNMKHPVRMKSPNAYGLYDMLGNVFEMTNDYYDQDYYSFSPSTNPKGPDTGSGRVTRGGGYSSTASLGIRVSYRTPADGDLSIIGFRCARDVEP